MGLPIPCCWPEPITLEQFETFAPEKLELVDGYLLGPPDSEEARQARIRLMVLLLANCGLGEATMFSDEYHWREAIDRSWLELY